MADHALSKVEFFVVGFDPRDASLTVLNSMGYSASNRSDAVDDAQDAAAAAQARGLPLRYTVVRIAAEDSFPS
ncbi:MAG: hypothetical protein JWO67_6591 [Streptosporangiaceae bacterium]|jgi:hypothetical protein|nr:hypothetical protein [Streptosporangiaceae bacterium]